jgi:hypothetical protein
MDSQDRENSIRSHAKPKRKTRLNSTPIERGDSLVISLTAIAGRLAYIRATAVTVQLALSAQNGDQDVDIAACIRAGVCDALNDQFTQLGAIIASLGGAPSVPSL